jgi:hypothetical protein
VKGEFAFKLKSLMHPFDSDLRLQYSFITPLSHGGYSVRPFVRSGAPSEGGVHARAAQANEGRFTGGSQPSKGSRSPAEEREELVASYGVDDCYALNPPSMVKLAPVT